ncbi:MAG: DUF3999 family protein [Acidobacteriota bacterium]
MSGDRRRRLAQFAIALSTSRLSWWVCAIAVIAAAAATAAQQRGAPAGFRHERAVLPAGAGPQRLAIDVPLLAGGAPFTVASKRSGPLAENGLRDLRLFDSAGAPVPHIFIYPPRIEPEWALAEVLPVARTEKTSGFEADLGRALAVDAIAVSAIPSPFLKRIRLEGSGDRLRWTILVADGTLFDLPAESLRQTTVEFAAGSYRYLRVTWDDRNSARVAAPLAVRARRVTAATPPPTLVAPLAVERRPSEPGVSRFRVRLPGPHLPITSIELDVRAGHVLRNAVVYESRLVGGEAVPVELGRELLKRVERDGLSAGSLRIPVLAPAEAELELVVEDGSNPPLELAGATAQCAALPWIYFEAPVGTVVARYGNPSAVSPVYDLEAVRESVKVATVPDAKWGDVRELAPAEPATAASLMPETGAGLEIGGFSYKRALPEGGAGLVALVVDPAALAHSRGPSSRFADVRIVDGSSRQIPYLVERRSEPLPITLALEPLQSTAAVAGSVNGHSTSTYQLHVPFPGLPEGRLALETSARVFQRSVQVAIARPSDRRRRDPWVEVVATGNWSHSEQETAAPALLLTLPQTDASDVLLTIDEGDNSRLPISGVKLLLPSYRLRFYRPAQGPLSLVYGSRDASAPRYDLALLAPRVMGGEALEITPSAEAAAPAPRDLLVAPWVFWVLLGGAVAVLLALIARLVTQKT